MKYTVLYRKREFVKDSYFVDEQSLNLAHYQKITTVETDEPTRVMDAADDIYRRMNYVDGSDNELVGPGRLSVRSMMPGDLVVDELGIASLVKLSGWETFPLRGWENVSS